MRENRAEAQKQKEYIERLKALRLEEEARLGRTPTYRVETFGCQMNAKDSEKFVGILEEIGYTEAASEKEADFVLYNTCTVRENANDKLYGHLGLVHSRKNRVNPDQKVAISGCMMQEPDEVGRIRTDYRFVNLVFGTHNIFKFPELLYRMKTEENPVIDVWEGTEETVEDLPALRKYPFKSGVNVMYGCNNFCSYCIVPYVRGCERSREADEILSEVEKLAADGVVEVMLLGQNVNSYGKTLEHPVSFAELLKRVAAVPGIERVRFMTSHPKDLSDELIDAIAGNPKICRHFHLPLQSGSDRILKVMNRHYTKEKYLGIVRKLREKVPGIAITTDIIVGFPGETEEDFRETLEVVKEAQFESAFTFVYSKRNGTPAAKMEDQVPEEVVKDRFNRLLEVVKEVSAASSGRHVGERGLVLAEEVNRQDEALLTGRLDDNSLVHFKGDPSLIGKIVPVRITESKGFYYLGEIEA